MIKYKLSEFCILKIIEVRSTSGKEVRTCKLVRPSMSLHVKATEIEQQQCSEGVDVEGLSKAPKTGIWPAFCACCFFGIYIMSLNNFGLFISEQCQLLMSDLCTCSTSMSLNSDNFSVMMFCIGPGGRNFAIFARDEFLQIVVANPENSNDRENVYLDIESTYSALRCCPSYGKIRSRSLSWAK